MQLGQRYIGIGRDDDVGKAWEVDLEAVASFYIFVAFGGGGLFGEIYAHGSRWVCVGVLVICVFFPWLRMYDDGREGQWEIILVRASFS